MSYQPNCNKASPCARQLHVEEKLRSIHSKTASSSSSSSVSNNGGDWLRAEWILANQHKLCDMATYTHGYSATHGILLATEKTPRQQSIHGETTASQLREAWENSWPNVVYKQCPVTLLPVKVPQASWEAMHVQNEVFGRLVHGIANTPDYLYSKLDEIAQYDRFVGDLLSLSKKLPVAKRRHGYFLTATRVDYMLVDEAENKEEMVPKLVEINCIAAGMGSLCSRVNELQKDLLARYCHDDADVAALGCTADAIVSNPGLTLLVDAFHSAINTYKQHVASVVNNTDVDAKLSQEEPKKQVVMMMIVQHFEHNVVDHALIEQGLWDTHKVLTVRKTLSDLAECMQVDSVTGVVYIDGQYEVGLVYFRAGYTPLDFPSDKEWNALEQLTGSQTIMCPSVEAHLVGTKRIQRQLCLESELKNFLSDQDVDVIMPAMTEMYDFDACPALAAECCSQSDCSSCGGVAQERTCERTALDDAIAHPHRYVLKPSREGGGNNLWDADIAAFLRANPCGSNALRSFVLMSRFFPVSHVCPGLANGTLQVRECVTEFGIFSYTLSNAHTNQILFNNVGGHLLRTKAKEEQEGGVSSGHAMIDTVVLV